MTFNLPINDDCTVLLQSIGEDELALRANLTLTPLEQEDLDSIRHPDQRIEWLACRVAVQQLAAAQRIPYVGLQKDEFGKPHLIGSPWFVSLSHTNGWAAAVLHRSRPVGVDVEPIREQLRRVVPRVLSASEIAHAAGSLDRLAVYWCAKEALYKLYGKRALTFREHLHIEPFADGAEQLVGHVRVPGNPSSEPLSADFQEQLILHCFRVGPGLLAVAY